MKTEFVFKFVVFTPKSIFYAFNLNISIKNSREKSKKIRKFLQTKELCSASPLVVPLHIDFVVLAAEKPKRKQNKLEIYNSIIKSNVFPSRFCCLPVHVYPVHFKLTCCIQVKPDDEAQTGKSYSCPNTHGSQSECS